MKKKQNCHPKSTTVINHISHHQTKTDSEVTSLDASSTTRSPRRPAYYVQSPSHDGEKTTTSFHSTPVISPMDSPPHSHSSSSRFSGSRKLDNNHRSNTKPWKKIDVIEEEGLLNNSLSRRWYFLAFILGFFLLFTLFSPILWGASRPMKPHVMIKGIKFEHVRVQAGSDATGVATDMITVNATVKFTYPNKGTFFGVHASSTPLDLSYSEIVIGTGNVKVAMVAMPVLLVFSSIIPYTRAKAQVACVFMSFFIGGVYADVEGVTTYSPPPPAPTALMALAVAQPSTGDGKGWTLWSKIVTVVSGTTGIITFILGGIKCVSKCAKKRKEKEKKRREEMRNAGVP